MARARNVDIDARRDYPYAAYDEMKFDVPVYDSNDVWATVLCALLETYESIKIISQCLDKMPNDGPILTELEAPIPALKHGLAAVEAPRGEVVHYVHHRRGERARALAVRAPNVSEPAGRPLMLLGNQLADVPIIIGASIRAFPAPTGWR